MDDILRQYNYTAYIPEDDECVLVIEDKPEVTATAEIVPETLALDIIRHNNQNINEPSKYKKYVAEIDNQHLEDWYDELYQMMLLALLLLDNIERQKSIDELKEKVAGK